VYVDAQATLDAAVPEADKEAYYRRFGHWRGSPPQLVDTHPNPAAHRIIAREILRRLAPAR
jgi:lysophospholipase L1-like esterase